VPTLVPDTDFGAFSVFIAASDLSLEEIVPGITALKILCVEELDLIALDREEEILARFNQDEIQVVFRLEVENRALFDLIEGQSVEHRYLTFFVKTEQLAWRKLNDLDDFIVRLPYH